MNDNISSLSPEDSLRVINEMIAQAKRDYEHKSFFFLLWGWLLFLTGIGIFLLMDRYPQYPNGLWFVQGIIGGVVSSIYGARQAKRSNVDSHVNRIIQYIWIAFGITLFFIIFAAVQSGVNSIPMVLITTAFPTFLTGRILKFNALTVGGVCFWIFGVISLYIPMAYTPLVFSAAILAGYIIPGYLLRQAEQKRASV
jgi:uncharacterized membrane protein SirB2